MKKLIILSIALIITVSVSAQSIISERGFNWGVKGGLNATSLSNDFNLNTKASFYAGAYAKLFITENWAIQSEIVYSRQGAQDEVNELKILQRINYINIPILAKYYIVKKLSVEVGPQLGIKLDSESKFDDYKLKNSEAFTSVDLSLAIGASYYIMNNISVNVRCNIGLTNILTNKSYSSTNNVFQLGLSYAF